MVKWNLEDIYHFEDTEKLIKELKEKVEGFKSIRERLSADLSTDEFMSIVRRQEEISFISQRLGAYAGLWLTENTSDPKRTAHESMIDEITTHLSNDMLFFGQWFKNLSDEEASKYIKASGKYMYALETFRRFKKFMLNEAEEKIMSIKDMTGSDELVKIYDIIANRFTFTWKGNEVTQEELMQYVRSTIREERVKAYNALLTRYAGESPVLGELYSAIAKDWRNENITIRGFSSPISVRNMANDIPDKSVDALLNVVRKRMTVFHEYFKLKSKICDVKMDRYDLYMPYLKERKEYSYEKSRQIVLEMLDDFDHSALEMVNSIFDSDHVHSEVVKNKRTGAFCSFISVKILPYIMLNHVGKLEDVFTMAHEFGHGMHNILASGQTELTAHPALPLAETASIFNEMLLSQYMMKSADNETKKAILMKMLDGQFASIPRQAYFVNFEKEAHEALAKGDTIDDLNKIYASRLKEQFGDLEVPEIFMHEWKYIPHIYHTPFYCYAYSFGNLLVLSLYKMYKEEGKSFVPKYFKLLSYGGSKAPAEMLKELDIDINSEDFWNKGFDIIEEEIEELKRLA